MEGSRESGPLTVKLRIVGPWSVGPNCPLFREGHLDPNAILDVFCCNFGLFFFTNLDVFGNLGRFLQYWVCFFCNLGRFVQFCEFSNFDSFANLVFLGAFGILMPIVNFAL